MKPGILIRDFDWTGVDSDDLGRVLRELPVIINLIDELGQYAPFVRKSERHPGCTEDTPLGATLTDLHKWLQYQLDEAYQALRLSIPRPDLAEFRTLDLLAHMARHTGGPIDIATVALTLEKQPTAALERDEHGWVKSYLAERKAHD